MSVNIFEGNKARRMTSAIETISQNIENLIAPDVAQETAVIAEAKRWVDGKDLAGNPVPSTAPQYENNAKYYTEQTEAAKTTAVQAIEDKGEQVLHSIPSEYTELNGDVEDLKSALDEKAGIGELNSKAPAIIYNASGETPHFVSDEALPLASAIVEFDFAQSGSGIASLDNVRPITVYEKAAVTLSATAEAANGITYETSLENIAGKVVAGMVDVCKGILKITKYAFDPHDMVSMTREGTTDTAITIGIRPANNNLPAKAATGAVSNRFSKSVTPTTEPGYMTETSGWIYVRIPLADLADTTWPTIRQWFADNPTIIAYDLAEPVEYSLPPKQIVTLTGDNYLTSNGSRLSVEAVVDTKTYIDQKNASIGDLNDLNVSDKSSIVSAVNEAFDDIKKLDIDLVEKAPAIIEALSGDVVHFVTDKPVKIQKVLAEIKLSQTGSGNASPTNVRQISGFDTAIVTVSGDSEFSEATDYAVSFGDDVGLVYGGTLDVVSGNLTITNFAFNPSTLSSLNKDSETAASFTLRIPKSANNLPANKSGGLLISNRFSKVIASGTPGRITESTSYFYLVLPIDEMESSTVAAARAWLIANPTVVVYELAEPITYSLTPVQITALPGDNYIKANSGNITVGVVVDTEVYIDKKYNDLYALIGEQGIEIPPYFQDNVDTAVANYKTNAEKIGNNGDSFVFITDVHWGVNQKHSPNLIRYLISKSNLRNVICGGDILDSGTVADELAKGYDFMERFAQIPGYIKTVTGNHDYNKNGHASTPALWLTPNQAYSMFCAKNEMEIHDVNSSEPDNDGWQELTYYMDVPATKTRYLFASIAYGAVFTATKNWIISQLEDNPNLNFVIFSHYLFGSDDYTTGVKALFNLVKGYSNLKAWLFGHTHYDFVDYLDTGIPLVCTDTDSSRLNATHNLYDYIVGTITEQAFDAVTVDYSNRNVYCARVGRGKNRIVNGGINTVSGTLTFTTDIVSPVWTSSNTDVAIVANGVVTAVASGNCIVKAYGTDDEEYWYVRV